MSCCTLAQLPEGWDSLPTIPDHKMPVELARSLQTNMKLGRGTPGEYQAHVAVRVTVIVLLIIGISVGVMALDGTLATFPESVVRWFQNANWMQVGIGFGVFAVMTAGAVILIYKVQHQKDRHLESASNGFAGDAKWGAALYQSDKHGFHPGYLDTSTLDVNGDGYAYMYALKDEQGHYTVSTVVFAITPVHMVAAIAYNVIRLVIIPIYILGCMLFEKCTGESIERDRPFTATDILWEVGKSLWRIVKAPFYALAFMYAALYSFIDPLNGRKLGSYLERDWNEGVTRAEGYWSVGGPQSLWLWEGGGTPSGLGRNGFYLAGCWQPIARVQYQNGVRTGGESLSHAVDPSRGQLYTIHTAADMKLRHTNFVSQLRNIT